MQMVGQHRKMMRQAVESILIPFLINEGYTRFISPKKSLNHFMGNRISPWGRFRKKKNNKIIQIEIIVNSKHKIPKIHLRGACFDEKISFYTDEGSQFISSDGSDGVFIVSGMESYSLVDCAFIFKRYGVSILFSFLYSQKDYNKIIKRICSRIKFLENSIIKNKSEIYVIKSDFAGLSGVR